MAQLAYTEFERRENLSTRFPAAFIDPVVRTASNGPCTCNKYRSEAVAVSR